MGMSMSKSRGVSVRRSMSTSLNQSVRGPSALRLDVLVLSMCKAQEWVWVRYEDHKRGAKRDILLRLSMSVSMKMGLVVHMRGAHRWV